MGIVNIETLIESPEEQKNLYLTGSYEEIIASPLFDKTKYNDMAKKGYAFLKLTSTLPEYFKDIDSELLNNVSAYQMQTIQEYRNYQNKGLIKWNISAVPNIIWAKDLFGEENVEKLWNLIFDVCLINEENPTKVWNEKMELLKKRAEYLNKLNIDRLIYKNSLGTNVEIGLPKDYLFQCADGLNLVNMPTEEVFTSPDRLRVNGKVCSSKILIHNNRVIDNFWLEFKDGKIVDYDAKIGKDILKGIIETDEGSHYLGEVALVDFDSPISETNVIFKNTLFDENASCHLAIGTGFSECIKNGLEKSNEELLTMGVNYSNEHVDFFIGTDDLNIKAILQNGQEIVIMEYGNFVMED